MSSRSPFHAPECDCPKCGYADGQDAERAAVVKYLREWADDAGSFAAGPLRGAAAAIEKGEHREP
jgi:hypothetical protein